MKNSHDELLMKLSRLKESEVLTESEFQHISNCVSGNTAPWLSITSLILSSLGLILLDSNAFLFGEIFAISGAAGIGGLITGILGVSHRENNRFIAVISILLSLFVLSSIVIIMLN